MTTIDQERLALETRAEALAFVSADAAVRRGESDRFEIGRLASSDAVDGQEAQHTGGAHVESAHAHSLRAARLETRVDGGMSLRGRSDTTLLGGAMAETHAGPVLLMAGMSDALVAGGGMRVTVADLAVAGLVGLEEKIGSAIADGALIEAYATHFEREYGSGSHVAGFASFTGTVHVTSASGFRPLFKVASGVRNLTAGGGGGSGPEGAAAQPSQRPPPPILKGLDSVPLSEDVDQTTIIARLEDAQFKANKNAMSASANGNGALEAIHNDAAHLYSVALSSVRAGEDPQPLLDRFAALYRWRSESDLLAYPHQADVAADARSAIDATLRRGGYRAGAANADQTLDAGLLARTEELFDNREIVNNSKTTGAGGRGFIGEYSEVAAVGADASRGPDTAEVLSNLRAGVDVRSYEDTQRGTISIIQDGLDSVPLSEDVDQVTVIARLEDAQLKANKNAMSASAKGNDALEAIHNDAAQLYGIALSSVRAGEDPKPLLDRLAAFYRWRAERDLLAYPRQADAVADARASIDAALRRGGYRAGAANADQTLDAGLLARLEELFHGADEGAGATDELAVRIEDASDLLGNFLDDIDQGRAGAESPQNIAARDPQHLTLAELDAYQADGDSSWLGELSSAPGDLPGERRVVQDVPVRETGHLAAWDTQIVDFVQAHQKPALVPIRDGASAALLEDLRIAEAAVAARVDNSQAAGNAVLTNVLQDRHRTYRLAENAVRQGEDPLPALNELVAVYRWRAQANAETYANQARTIEEVRDEVAVLFRTNGVAAADELADPDYLAGVRGLSAAPEGLASPSELRVVQDASVGRATPPVEEIDRLHRYAPDETPGNFVAAAREGSDAAGRIRWQGRAADAEGLVDLSTDNILVRSDSDEAGLFDPNSWTEDNILYERTDNHRQAEWHDNEQYVRRDEISDSLEESPRLAEVGGTQIPRLPDGYFPFVPPRLPNDVDVDGLADFIGQQRKTMADLLAALPPTSDDVRWRAKIQALDLALEALKRGHDPLALLDDRIRSAKLRQSAGTPLIEDEVEILSLVRQKLGERFDTFRYSTGLHDFIAVDEARQIDQLRLNVPPSLADARSAGAEASGESGKVVNDFVHGADEQSFGLRRDTRRRPHIYEDIDAIRPVLPAEPSRRGPPEVLSFASNDPTRFLGRAQDGDIKPMFALTDSEFAAFTAGDLNLVVVDAHSRKSLSYDDFVIRHDVDDQPFGLRRDLGMQSHIDENTDAIGPVLPAEPSRRGPPDVLNFASDDPNRFVGRVRNSGLHGDPKPVFALTDSEFAAWNAGDLRLVVVDMNSLKSLSHDDFIIHRGIEQTALTTRLDLSAFTGRTRAVERWQSLPDLAADSAAAEITASGHRVTSPHGGGLSATPPSAGGAARPRQRPASFIDDQFVPI